MKYSLPVAGIAVIALLFTGCMTGPDYKKPDIPVPDKWSEPLEGGATGQSPQIAQWWKAFGDPTLDSLVARAIQSNHDLKIAEARIREARANLRFTETGLWPQVDLGGSYARSQIKEPSGSSPQNSLSLSPQGLSLTHSTARGAATASVSPTGAVSGALSLPLAKVDTTPDRHVDLYQAGFDAGWELDFFGGARRSVEASKADLEAVEEDRRSLLVTLVAEVAQNYFALRSAQSLLDIANNNIRIQTETYNIAKSRFDAGLTNELYFKTSEAQLATIQAVTPLLEASEKRSIHRLGVLLGREPGALQDELLVAAPLPVAPPEIPVGLPSDLLRRRPDIRSAERQLAAATARIGVATADLFPKFSLTGSFGGSGSALDAITQGANQTWSLGPSIRWPIFDAGRIRANIKVQNARQEQALIAYEKAVMLSLEDVENALVAYAKEQAYLKSITAALEADRKALEIAKALYSQGLVSFLHVLDAQRSLYATDEQQTQSKVAILTNLVSLYKALGGGWEQSTETHN